MGQLTTFRTSGARITNSGPTSDWLNDIQGASTGTVISNLNPTGTGTSAGVGTQAAYSSGRGGNIGTIVRTFYQFTVPSEAVGLITGITLRIVPYLYNNSGAVVVAKSTAVPFANSYFLSDFGSYQGTAYSGVIPAPNAVGQWPTTTGTTDTFDITLNSNAISDANDNSGVLKIVFMNYTYDFQISEPSLLTNVYTGIRLINGTDDTYGTRERLIVDYGYGNIVAGVAGANVGKVINVDTVNIDKVTGVSYT